MLSLKWLQRAAGFVVVLIGISGIFAFDFWISVLSPLSADGQIQPHTWLMLRVILIALLFPGLILIETPRLRPLLQRIHRWLDRLTKRQFFVYTLVASLISRAVWVAIVPMRMFIDWAEYDVLAWRLAQTGEFTASAGFLTTYRPPGYPFFLSLVYRMFGHSPKAGAIVNILLGIGVIYLTYLLARRFFGERTARWAAVVLIFFPSQILFINTLCSEVLFTFVLLLGLYFYTREDCSARPQIVAYALAGIIWGLAALVRPVALLLPFVLVPWWSLGTLRQRRVLLRMIVALAGIAVVVAPWIMRNHRVSGRATIATNGGVNFYIGNNPATTFGFNVPETDLSKSSSPEEEAEFDQLGYQWGWGFIEQHPVRFFKRGIMKLALMMTSDTEGWAYELIRAGDPHSLGRDVWLGVLFQAYYFVFLLAFLAGLWAYFRNREGDTKTAWPLFSLICYWLAVHFIFFGSDRFHYPIVPAMALIAALALQSTNSPAQAMESSKHN